MQNRTLAFAYVVIALAALGLTWSQNLAYFGAAGSTAQALAAFPDFLIDAAVNPAARSITFDILLIVLAASVWMVFEGRRRRMRFVWAYVVVGFLVAISVTFPLFLAARDDTPAHESGERARLGALGGNALIASEDMTGALAALDTARADANQSGDAKLGAAIQIDRARALVALDRPGDAAAALKEARELDPGSAQAWLLSATLSRRMDKLTDAQAQIQRAAELMPVDAQVGLEAGVIAMLSGREPAARKSWQSVIKVAPGSEAAKTAQGYLDQLGPEAAQPNP